MSKYRHALILVAIIGGLILVQGYFTREGATVPSSGSSEQTQTPEPGRVHITVTKSTYESGYLDVVGTVENTGTVPVYSLELNLKVMNDAGDTVLASGTTWPAGCFMEDFAPGAKAAFEFVELVPGEPQHIKYSVSAADPRIRWDVEYPTN